MDIRIDILKQVKLIKKTEIKFVVFNSLFLLFSFISILFSILTYFQIDLLIFQLIIIPIIFLFFTHSTAFYFRKQKQEKILRILVDELMKN